ncbi:MAG: BREX system P-loop protein BrxC, partial [Pyrinomonadaceae bacterium]
CDGEYLNGMRRILQSYVESFGKPEQKAAWISGFYGSGKSHLAKVLRYLWIDLTFDDGTSARTLSNLPNEIRELLKEISTLGVRHSGLHMAGGTLKAGVGSVRLRIVGLVFKSAGLPETYPHAKFLIDLKREGKLEQFRASIEAQGREVNKEIGRMYTSAAVAKAYVECSDHLNDASKIGDLLRSEYPSNVTDISMDDMIGTIRDTLATDSGLPCTLIVLDEVQQFIGQDSGTSLDVQEVTEALSKDTDGRIMIVGTGQSALSDMPNLQRLMGRFTVKVHLKDNDVEKVVRSVVLQKREDKKPEIEKLISKNEGEITRQLKGTKLETRTEDSGSYIPDFPLLPVRRRFWERVLHSVDSTGTAAQMRTQLRVVHEACKATANADLGAVVPADFIYDQISTDLVTTGEMQKRFQEIIEQQKGKVDGDLRSRVCSLVFLVNKLPREQGTDLGLRAEPEHLADLLSDDIVIGSMQLRQQLPDLLASMEQEGVLMKVDDEYHLQTTEGAAWESEFRKRKAAAVNDSPMIAALRAEILRKELTSSIGAPSVLHGDSKERRKVEVHYGETKPDASESIVLWVRDGFDSTEGSVRADIQKLSTDDATLHLFIPKSHGDELNGAIASAKAADETLHAKGNPTSDEGKQCRQSMVTRKATEDRRIDEFVGQILLGARLYLSGGQDQPFIALKTGIEDAATQVLNRLYPKFSDGDSAKWPQVLKKAKEGSVSSLSLVGHNGDPQTHPVATAILAYIGSGKTGLEIRKKFNASPYGWPQDAIDGVLATLLTSNHLSARINNNPIGYAEIDQKKLGQAMFRIESPVLTATQKIVIRKLFQDSGLTSVSPGNEQKDSIRFIEHAKTCAAGAGGEAPCPQAPVPSAVHALDLKNGNELLQDLHDQREELLTSIKEWQTKGELISKRLNKFELAEKIVAQGSSLSGHAERNQTLADIKSNRSLLHEPDPVSGVLTSAANALRTALVDAHKAYARTFDEQTARGAGQPEWKKLSDEKRKQLLISAGAIERSAPVVETDEKLLSALEVCSLDNWRSHTDALPAQFDKALAAAIIEAEPKAKRLTLQSATIHDSAELDSWLQKSKADIEAALKDGPVIL